MSQGFTVLKNTSNRENPQTTRSDFVKNKKEKN